MKEKSKRTVQWRVALAAIVLSALAASLITNGKQTHVGRALRDIVKEQGPPALLAKYFELDQRDMKVLRVFATKHNPAALGNWGSISNIVGIWAGSDSFKRNARYFYDEKENDQFFTGSTWYSSRSLGGEKLLVLRIDESGVCRSEDQVRVNAVSMSLPGFEPKNSNVVNSSSRNSEL